MHKECVYTGRQHPANLNSQLRNLNSCQLEEIQHTVLILSILTLPPLEHSTSLCWLLDEKHSARYVQGGDGTEEDGLELFPFLFSVPPFFPPI